MSLAAAVVQTYIDELIPCTGIVTGPHDRVRVGSYIPEFSFRI